MQQIQFQQSLESLQKQYEESRQLQDLYFQLMPHGMVPSFGQQLGTATAGMLGQAGAIAGGSALAGAFHF